MLVAAGGGWWYATCRPLDRHDEVLCACPSPPLPLRYWYPLQYFISLAFAPSALIGLNADLRMPKAGFACGCRPSIFAYPPPLAAEVKETVRWHGAAD